MVQWAGAADLENGAASAGWDGHRLGSRAQDVGSGFVRLLGTTVLSLGPARHPRFMFCISA